MKNSVMMLASLLLLGAFSSSCRSTFLLKEDFSGDVVGNRPISDVPGDPAGDLVTYDPVLNPRLSIQASTVSSGRKALVFSEVPIPGATVFNQWLGFKGVPTDYAQPIWFYWTAKQRNSQSELLIDIMGMQGLWVTRLKILPNGQLIRIINFVTGDEFEVLGTFNPQATHTIIVSLQPTARKYNISVFGLTGSGTANRTNLNVFSAPMPDQPPGIPDRPSIYFRYSDERIDTTPAYVFEGVYINRKQPD